MKDIKYLNTLKVNQLKEIIKKNNLKSYINNTKSYLKKDEMIKIIQKNSLIKNK